MTWLTVHSIADYYNLSEAQRQSLQYAIKSKERLLAWIRQRNMRPPVRPASLEPWVRCPRCIQHVGICECKAEEHEGWVRNEEEEVRDNSGIHPSGVTDCLKTLYYACSGRAEEHHEFIDPELQMIFDMGHGWHRIMQKVYGRKGAWCHPDSYHDEVQIDPTSADLPLAQQYWIRGHADALIDDYQIPDVPGLGAVSVRLVHEYKTINDAGYKKLTKPKPEHAWQATIYSAVLDAPFVVYLYTDKNNSQTVEYTIPFNQRLWDGEITKKILAVQSYVNAKVDPPWEMTSAKLSPRDCFECGYRPICRPPV